METRLDKIPPEYPYEVVANLREIHRLLHLGVETNEQSSVTNSFTNIDELIHALMNFKPTDLKKALDLVDATTNITQDHFLEPGNTTATGLLSQLYSHHIPLDKIEHSF